MSAPVKLAVFAGVFAGGALAGELLGPDRQSAAVAANRGPAANEADGHTSGAEPHAGTSAAAIDPTPGSHGAGKRAADPVRGLAVAENGLRLVLKDAELRRGRAKRLTFRIVDERGEAVRDFDVEHGKRMHLILARRDLTGFQHLHPAQRADGAWIIPVRLEDAGSYRLYADFTHDDRAFTLATDLRVDGKAELQSLPVPQTAAVTDGGYEVRLEVGHPRPGKEAELRFAITRRGEPVAPESYLGAGGHLVALRDGDLAFLHVHPMAAGHGDEAERDGSVSFAATLPTAGRYRLFLQFQHEGRVHTVAFTQEVN